ncbi:hypothetical protein TRFO_05259 [Tritrichomonas foetus]|uniref:Transmembrane protein n=1 Tax=Tritrichomonas foetus TaxID=1144522 RepID=A0A1J4K6H1_9EUKA|nr:hypothetical protein TRFO_05259 [Tritrichomonas foetus]|eukprot:OHT07065.1 hypothetical protein TRFO_05259 [Tritrichomonas foetus]
MSDKMRRNTFFDISSFQKVSKSDQAKIKMGFPVIAICEICFCAPTIICALIPLVSCHQRVPFTSTFCNLLSNACWAACVYGLFEMSKEEQFDFDRYELISIVTFVAAIVVFLLFRFKLLNLACFSERDSIEYVPSMVKNSYYDMYTLLESITRLRSYPPLIFINAEASHLVKVDNSHGNTEDVTWNNETLIPFGSWRDTTEMPIFLTKSFLLDVHCSIEYKLSRELEDMINDEKHKFEEENRNRDSIIHTKVELDTPGYSPHFYASTRGAIPGYLKFLKSKGGLSFREFLMFLGYHSILECIWMMMMKHHDLVLRKELSHENVESWTPMGETCRLDYHNVPHIE